MRCLLYDCTHLLAQSPRQTPSGIERVALQYLDAFLTNETWGDCIGVYQTGELLRPLSSAQLSRLHRVLQSRWGTGEARTDALEDLRGATVGQDVEIHGAGAASDAPKLDPALGDALLRTDADAALYVNVTLSGMGDAALFDALRDEIGGQFLFLVHDLVPVRYTEYYPKDPSYFRAVLRNISTYASHVVAVSHATADDLRAYLQQADARVPPIQVLPPGVAPGYASPHLRRPSSSPSPPSDPFFVVLGTLEPRKNHRLLLQVWRDWAAHSASDPPTLLLLGADGWMNEETKALLERCDALSDCVVHRSGCSDAEVRALLRDARALLMPSFAEGWGLPIVESLTLNTPVIASDLPVFREASQGAAVFLSPLNGPAWRTAVADFCDDASDRYRTASAAADAFVPPSWDDHFQGLAEALPQGAPNAAPPSLSSRSLRSRARTLRSAPSEVQARTPRDWLAYAVLPSSLHASYERFKAAPVRWMEQSRWRPVHRLGRFLRRGL